MFKSPLYEELATAWNLLMKHKQRSLKSTLLWLLLPIIVLIMLTSLVLSLQTLKTQVNQAFDRTLAGALRSIEVNIRTDHGGLSMEQPFYLFEFLELATQSPVYFRVFSEDGLTEIGFSLPSPTHLRELTPNPSFYDSHYFGEKIRVAAMAIYPKQGLSYAPSTRLIILVAEGLNARDKLFNQMIWQTLTRDLITLVIFAVIISIGIIFALRPLQQLSNKIANRNENDLRPIIEQELPSEITPLVDAINTHMERYERKSRLQRQFLDDASHQLRTPLAVLNTQLGYAKSLADKNSEMEEVLIAIQHRLSKTIDITNQLLTLAKVQDAADKLHQHLQFDIVNLSELTQQTVNELLPIARRKKLDYGLDIPEHTIWVQGVAWLIREALSNLITNAIKYSPKHSQITIFLRETHTHILLSVEDNGPGMSAEDIALAGKRFRRGEAGREQQGSGLGLAIVQTIAEINHAELELITPPSGGLLATLKFTPPILQKTH